jgi:hypothetical protein
MGIKKNTSVTNDFWVAGRVTGNEWGTFVHDFERWHIEAL